MALGKEICEAAVSLKIKGIIIFSPTFNIESR